MVIDRVDLVDKGANQKAHIVLTKRLVDKLIDKSSPTLSTVHVDSPDWDPSDADEWEKADLSAEGRRGLPDSAFAAVWTDSDGKKHRKLPIHDAGHLAAARGRVDGADIPENVKAEARRKIEAKSTGSSKEKAMKKGLIKRLFDAFSETDVEKRAAAVASIEKEFPDDLKDKVEHKPGDEECKCADCMSKSVAKAKADEDAKAEADVLAKGGAEVAKKLTDLEKRNVDLEKKLNAEIEKGLDREMVEILKSFKATAFDIDATNSDNDIRKFRKMKQDTPDAFDRTMALLKAADSQVAASAGFHKSIGSSRSGPGGSAGAWAQIEAKADAMIAKSADSKLTREMAINKVMESNPSLVRQYREEQQ